MHNALLYSESGAVKRINFIGSNFKLNGVILAKDLFKIFILCTVSIILFFIVITIF